jgi:hypothetical protein
MCFVGLLDVLCFLLCGFLFSLLKSFSVFLVLFRKDLFRFSCLPACPPVRGIFVRPKETKKKKKKQETNKEGNEEGG